MTFPIHAGVILITIWLQFDNKTFPRTCGVDPCYHPKICHNTMNKQKSKNAQKFLVLLLPSRLRRATVSPAGSVGASASQRSPPSGTAPSRRPAPLKEGGNKSPSLRGMSAKLTGGVVQNDEQFKICSFIVFYPSKHEVHEN